MYILAMATLMTLLVGLSRIALGVHWATDVAAGWAFGAAWALTWLLLARRLSRTSLLGMAERRSEESLPTAQAAPPRHMS
jgi:membrane-associated phospholipid phosphatase